MREIVFYGEMAERYGERHRMDIASPAEVVRAFGAQIKGFRQYIIDNSFEIVVIKNGKAIGVEEHTLNFRFGENVEIHFAPAVEGAKKGMGIGKLLLGIVIAAVAWFAAPAIGGMAAGIGVGGLTYGNVAMFGLAMAASGVSSLLTQNQKPKPTVQEAQNNSFMFNGDVNVAEQGGPVPLAYGRCRVGSTVISSGVKAFDIPLDPPTYHYAGSTN
jgi:predicted phage tail protein